MLYVKVHNQTIQKYPYSISNLIEENPQVSFPQLLTQDVLREWDVFVVKATPQPTVDYTKTITEGSPILVDGSWVQTWVVSDKAPEKIVADAKELRAEAYRNESDPIFFKAQRGEATIQDWKDKVSEIKTRYPG